MLTLPNAIVAVLLPFATLFTNPARRKAKLRLVGVILIPGQRTVAAALRVMGRSDQREYARYHKALNRAVWSSRAVARVLLLLLLQRLDRGDSPLVFGIRSFEPIGKPWNSLMWLGPVPWAGLHWVLPALTVLAPSSRYHQRQGRRHKKITDWARQMVIQLCRWLPHRPLGLAGDNGYAVLDLIHCCQSLREPVILIARLRLDAALYARAPPRPPGQKCRSALKDHRRPS